MHTLWQDVSYGARTLIQRPGFTLAATIALGLGIGANTAIFSVVNALMIRPLAVPQAGDLVSVVGRSSLAQFEHGLSFPDYRDYRGMEDVFSDAAAYTIGEFRLTAQEHPERIMATVTSGNYFSLLHLDARLGRAYRPEEGDLGGEPVIVLGHGYWQSRFGGDPSIVGQPVSLNGQPVTVIGVTPEDFSGTVGYVRTDAYIPLSVWGLLRPSLQEELEERGDLGWRIVARLKDGVDIEEARAAVATMASHLEKEYPDTNENLRAFVFPEPLTRLEPAAASFLPSIAAIFMALVSLVLLIACANVANLLLARAAERKREMALRSALGAGRLRILRQLLTESLLIALLGGAAGLVMAHWAGTFLASIRVASDLNLEFDFSIDYRVFGYALVAALVAGVLSGLVPAVHALRTNLVDALKEGGRTGAGAARQPLRSLLVTAQVAVSLVLLVSTALFVQSMRNVSRVDPGFEAKNRILLTVDTGLRNYDEGKAASFFRDLLGRIRSLPGVRAAATARFVPVGFENGFRNIYPEGEGEGLTEETEREGAMYNVVSTDYFATLGIPILEGRAIDEQDTEDGRKVVVVNQKMAETFWPEQDPLGKRFGTGEPGGPLWEVVGLAKTGFYILPGEAPRPMFYIPFTQERPTKQTLFVHTETDSAALLPVIQDEIATLDPDLPLYDVRTLESHVQGGKAELLFRLPAKLVGAFAFIGAVLAALGLYGVIAYSVTQRTHEIGLRVALGATSRQIVRLVLSKGAILAALGVGVGLVLTFVVTRSFAHLLIGVNSTDLPTYAAVSILVMLVALTAGYIPARFRAARIEPVVALREE